MMPACSWPDAGQEAGDVDQGQHRDVERVAGAHEPRGLLRCVDVEAAGEVHRLVGHDADRRALDATETDDDVLREAMNSAMHLEEITVVDQMLDDLVHVVGRVRRVGDERVEEGIGLVDLVRHRGVVRRQRVEVVRRQV